MNERISNKILALAICPMFIFISLFAFFVFGISTVCAESVYQSGVPTRYTNPWNLKLNSVKLRGTSFNGFNDLDIDNIYNGQIMFEYTDVFQYFSNNDIDFFVSVGQTSYENGFSHPDSTLMVSMVTASNSTGSWCDTELVIPGDGLFHVYCRGIPESHFYRIYFYITTDSYLSFYVSNAFTFTNVTNTSTNDIIDNQNANTQKEIDAANKNSQSEINAANQNSKNEINNANTNSQNEINNANKNQQQTNEGLDDINKTQQETNKKIDETNDYLMDDTPPESDISVLGNVTGLLPAGPVDSLLNIPFNFLSILTSSFGGVCREITGTFVFGSTLTIPCFSSIFYDKVPNTLMIFLDIIPTAFMLITYFKHLYKKIERATSLETNSDDEWGVI